MSEDRKSLAKLRRNIACRDDLPSNFGHLRIERSKRIKTGQCPIGACGLRLCIRQQRSDIARRYPFCVQIGPRGVGG